MKVITFLLFFVVGSAQGFVGRSIPPSRCPALNMAAGECPEVPLQARPGRDIAVVANG